MALIENPLNSSELAFPILECIHILGFTFSVGTAALVNFCLLGFGLSDRSPAKVWRDTSLWTLAGLSVMIFSGLLLFSTDPDGYYLNYPFLFKMVFLILAIAYNYTVVRRTAASNPPNGNKGVAVIGLTLWALVIFGGIFTGFFNLTLDIHNL